MELRHRDKLSDGGTVAYTALALVGLPMGKTRSPLARKATVGPSRAEVQMTGGRNNVWFATT